MKVKAKNKSMGSGVAQYKRDARLGVILVLPVVLFMLVLVAYPLVNMVQLSLQNYNILSGIGKFVGLNNFMKIFKNDEFWRVLKNTVIYSVGSLIPCAILGVIYALVLNRDIKGRSFIRAFVLFPYLIPMVVCAAMFRFMFNDLCGVFEFWLRSLGIIEGTLNLFGNKDLAMLGVIGVTVWKYSPMIMLAVLGRLQIIPKHLYEAAEIDGANDWKCFWHITFPYILPVLIVTLLMRFIFLFNKWDVIYLLTGGGPLGRTETLPTLVMNEAFSTYNFGKASAIGVVIFVILILASKLFFDLNEKSERRMV